eukprot:gene19887-26591_t
MEGRARRSIVTPKRFDNHDFDWSTAHQLLKLRSIYRVLKRRDIRKELKDHEVSPRKMMAFVHYEDSGEYEDIELTELIQSGHMAVIEIQPHGAKLTQGEIAVDVADIIGFDVYIIDYAVEIRPYGAKLKRGEIPVDAAERATAVYDEHDDVDVDNGVDELGNEEDSSSEEDEEESKQPAIKKSREGQRMVQRPRNTIQSVHGAPSTTSKGGFMGAPLGVSTFFGSQQPLIHGGAHTSGVAHSTGGAHTTGLRRTSSGGGGSGEGGVRRTSSGTIARTSGFRELQLTRNCNCSCTWRCARTETAAAPAVVAPDPKGTSSGTAATPAAVDPDPTETSSGTAAAPATIASDPSEVRRKAREQLTGSLEVAVVEVQREGWEGPLPAAAEIGAAVELALFTGELSPRDRVNLSGELSPRDLVKLSPTQLASKELSQWREKKSEEFDKGKFLDDETAAKFSTAAASLLKGRRQAALAAAAPDKADFFVPSTTDGGTAARDTETAAASLRKGRRQAALAAAALVAAAPDKADFSVPSTVDSRTTAGGTDQMKQAWSEGTHPHQHHAHRLFSGEMDEFGGVEGEDLPVVIEGGGCEEEGTGLGEDLIGVGQPSSLEDLLGWQPASQGQDVGLHMALEALGGSGAAEPSPTAKGMSTIDSSRAKKVSLAAKPASPSGQRGSSGIDFGDDDEREYDPDADNADAPAARAGNFGYEPPHEMYMDMDPGVEDMSPIMSSADDATRGLEPGKPGEEVRHVATDLSSPPSAQWLVWRGRFVIPDIGTVAGACSYMGGSGHMSSLMGNRHLEIRGTVKLDKFEPFLEELRARSRSRCVTIGILKVPTGASQEERLATEGMVNHYRDKRRTGVCHPGPGLEAYLLPQCSITARLLKTARLLAPLNYVHQLPANIAYAEVMLLVIHRKDWRPKVPQPSSIPPASVDQANFSPASTSANIISPSGPLIPNRPNDPRHSDPRRPGGVDPRVSHSDPRQQQDPPVYDPRAGGPRTSPMTQPSASPRDLAPHQHVLEIAGLSPQQGSLTDAQVPPSPVPPPAINLSGLSLLAAQLGISTATTSSTATTGTGLVPPHGDGGPGFAVPSTSGVAAPITYSDPQQQIQQQQGPQPDEKKLFPIDLSQLASLASALGIKSEPQPQPAQQQQQQFIPLQQSGYPSMLAPSPAMDQGPAGGAMPAWGEPSQHRHGMAPMGEAPAMVAPPPGQPQTIAIMREDGSVAMLTLGPDGKVSEGPPVSGGSNAPMLFLKGDQLMAVSEGPPVSGGSNAPMLFLKGDQLMAGPDSLNALHLANLTLPTLQHPVQQDPATFPSEEDLVVDASTSPSEPSPVKRDFGVLVAVHKPQRAFPSEEGLRLLDAVDSLLRQPQPRDGSRLRPAPHHGPLGPMFRVSPPGPYGLPGLPRSAAPYDEAYDAHYHECLVDYDLENLAATQPPPHMQPPPYGGPSGPPVGGLGPMEVQPRPGGAPLHGLLEAIASAVGADPSLLQSAATANISTPPHSTAPPTHAPEFHGGAQPPYSGAGGGLPVYVAPHGDPMGGGPLSGPPHPSFNAPPSQPWLSPGADPHAPPTGDRTPPQQQWAAGQQDPQNHRISAPHWAGPCGDNGPPVQQQGSTYYNQQIPSASGPRSGPGPAHQPTPQGSYPPKNGGGGAAAAGGGAGSNYQGQGQGPPSQGWDPAWGAGHGPSEGGFAPHPGAGGAWQGGHGGGQGFESSRGGGQEARGGGGGGSREWTRDTEEVEGLDKSPPPPPPPPPPFPPA